MSKSRTNVTEDKLYVYWKRERPKHYLNGSLLTWEEFKNDMEDTFPQINFDAKNNKMVLEWFNNFVDYVQEYDDHIYDLACKWADKVEKENYGSK
tara:strand:- start:219 stop:503 length:285 start_codon:yes stop_codon:yes gene_type:complete